MIAQKSRLQPIKVKPLKNEVDILILWFFWWIWMTEHFWFEFIAVKFVCFFYIYFFEVMHKKCIASHFSFSVSISCFFFLWKTTRGRTRVCSTCNTYSRWYYKKKNKIQENPGKSVSLEIKEELKKCLCLTMCYVCFRVCLYVSLFWMYLSCVYMLQ